ncbi:hypothetical protein LIA77_00450 [Sarocladium implicatum]|nr:hypothetical protein LIA77_00450 [Sarocladium implicatum]
MQHHGRRAGSVHVVVHDKATTRLEGWLAKPFAHCLAPLSSCVCLRFGYSPEAGLITFETWSGGLGSSYHGAYDEKDEDVIDALYAASRPSVCRDMISLCTFTRLLVLPVGLVGTRLTSLSTRVDVN